MIDEKEDAFTDLRAKMREARLHKRATEEAIEKLLEAFTRDTGIDVENIYLTPITTADGRTVGYNADLRIYL